MFYELLKWRQDHKIDNIAILTLEQVRTHSRTVARTHEHTRTYAHEDRHRMTQTQTHTHEDRYRHRHRKRE